MKPRINTARDTGNRRASNNQMKESGDQMDSNRNELHELFLDELADIYNAEKQLTKALPRMAKAAQTPELRQAFETHLRETENQIKRLEQAAEALDESLKRKKCMAMEGLLAEGKEILEEQKGSSALDAGLIAAAQKVEHYEIATYGTLCRWAELMGHTEALNLLKQNLAEEKSTDEKLTQVAERTANVQAQS
jgi:ferritin-like metal-binding protein YciE